MIREREETPEAQERRVKWMRGADPNQPLFVDVQGWQVNIGQPEKLDLRLNRIAVPLASLTQLLHSVVSAMSAQAIGVVGEQRAGGDNGPA